MIACCTCLLNSLFAYIWPVWCICHADTSPPEPQPLPGRSPLCMYLCRPRAGRIEEGTRQARSVELIAQLRLLELFMRSQVAFPACQFANICVVSCLKRLRAISPSICRRFFGNFLWIGQSARKLCNCHSLGVTLLSKATKARHIHSYWKIFDILLQRP